MDKALARNKLNDLQINERFGNVNYKVTNIIKVYERKSKDE